MQRRLAQSISASLILYAVCQIDFLALMREKANPGLRAWGAQYNLNLLNVDNLQQTVNDKIRLWKREDNSKS